jgi:hypothetical protein
MAKTVHRHFKELPDDEKSKLFNEWLDETGKKWSELPPMPAPITSWNPGATAWHIARAITWALTVTIWNLLAAHELYQLFATGEGRRIWGVAACLFVASFVGLLATQRKKR